MKIFELQPGERIIRTFWQSDIVLLKPASIVVVIIVAVWYYILSYHLPEYSLVAILASLFSLSYFTHQYRLWSLQEYIISNRRLIKQFHQSIFKKTVVETPLDRILNVSFKTTGIFSVLFGFGDVEVQVVGLIEPIILKNIRYPERIKEYLWRAHEEAVKQQGQGDIIHLQERNGYTKQNQRVM